MRFLLDASALVDLLRGNQTLPDLLRGHRTSDFGVSVLSYYELWVGAHKSRRLEANLRRALEFETLPFSEAERAGEIRAALEAAGTPIGPYDTLIAGQALSRSLSLITRNLGEFGRVAELKCEDWTEGKGR